MKYRYRHSGGGSAMVNGMLIPAEGVEVDAVKVGWDPLVEEGILILENVAEIEIPDAPKPKAEPAKPKSSKKAESNVESPDSADKV